VSGDDRHSLADHALGALYGHVHEGDDHDHDHFDASEDASPQTLISLGLDIGSSSTQAVLSRLELHGSGRGRHTHGTVLYASPVMATPFRGEAIDEAAVWAILERVFREGGVGPDQIDTGAVILTGAAARRDNAAVIAARLSEAVGDLVCAAAGDHMEAMLAAFGSGAVAASREGGGRRLLLVDVGGATTKLALLDRGEVLATAALNVGGRLLVVDREDRLVRLEPWGVRHAGRAGLSLAPGGAVPAGGRSAVAEVMATLVLQAVEAALGDVQARPDLADAMLTPPISPTGAVDGVMVSGGVGEYVYGRERRDFNDLGLSLGLALRRRLESETTGARLLEPAERIRATVIGASRYTVQVSGDTLYLSSHAALLPRRNLPVLRLPLDLSGVIEPQAVAEALHARLTPGSDVAVALRWGGEPSHDRLHALARGLVAGLAEYIAEGRPLYLLLEGDVAASLGALLRHELGVTVEVLAIDGVNCGEFDYLDLGRIRLPSRTVPVTVKSLLVGFQ
jgi:ethanolamine utilization protein EutA